MSFAEVFIYNKS